MAKSWCKVSAGLDSHPRIRRAGNLGRQVFEFALRRNAELDKNGVIPAEHLEPDYLADVLMFSREDAVTGLSACVRTRLLASDGDQYVICGWDDEWGKHPMTEAERKRVSRAKARKDTDVTICPDTIVTESDGPECHRSEESRSEEKRERAQEPQTAATAAPLTLVSAQPRAERSRRTPAAKQDLPDSWQPSETEANRDAEREARQRGVSIELELAKMRDWNKAGGPPCKDWDARWRNWLRQAKPMQQGFAAGNSNWSNNTGIRKTNIL